MILVVDLSERPGSLSVMEFAEPVRGHLVRGGFPVEVVHFRDLPGRMTRRVNGNDGGENGEPDAVFLCGTALMDKAYRDELERFSWLWDYTGTVLGICAGMHVICLLWGGKLTEHRRIGVFEETLVEDDPVGGSSPVIKGYHLHSCAVTIPEDFKVLRESDGIPSMIRHTNRNIYGVLFHPEVLSGDMLVKAAGTGRTR